MKITREIAVIVLFLVSIAARGQTIVFDYDDSGNRVSRELYTEQLKSGIIDFPVQESLLNDTIEVTDPSILVYPNPSKSYVFLEIKKLTQENLISYILFDLQGMILIEEPHGTLLNSIDMTRIPKGIYILRVKIDNDVFDYKIVKSY